MKITPMASEFAGIFASVVKTSRGYMTYIGGCVSKSRIAYCTDTTRIGPTSLFIRSTSSINQMCTVWALHVVVINFGGYVFLITCTCIFLLFDRCRFDALCNLVKFFFFFQNDFMHVRKRRKPNDEHSTSKLETTY